MKVSQQPVLALIGTLALATPERATAQWTELTLPADLLPSTALLLTDGRVICQNGGSDGTGKQWWALTPNQNGSYLHGKWAPIGSPMNNSRLF